MDYQQFYDYVVEEENLLRECEVAKDYKMCKALAALYELHEYLAGKIEDSDEDC